jgi:hypothetical protein
MHLLSILIISLLLSLSKLAAGQIMHIKINQIKCYNENSGFISISTDSLLKEPCTVVISDSSGKTLRQFYSVKEQPWELKDLKAGSYVVILQTKDNILKERQVVEIKSPDELKTNLITIQSVTKGDKVTYSLKSNPSGGILPYSYKWSANTGTQTSQVANNLLEGTYTCSITDNNGCGPKVATFFLYEPEIQKYKQQKRKK